MRSSISEMQIVPENGKLAIELKGDLARIGKLTSDSEKPVSQRDGLHRVTVVAGVRNHLYRTVVFALSRR